MNTNLYLYCALTDLDGGCDGGNGEGEAGDGTVSDCRILFIVLLSSSNHLHTILVYSAHLLHITLISYQMWVVVVEWKWKQVGCGRCEWSQHLRGSPGTTKMEWVGMERIHREKIFFSPQLRFKRHASARVVGWIQPKSRLRLFPGSALTFFPFFASHLFSYASSSTLYPCESLAGHSFGLA